ncbi:hypothetical protein DFH27DRAFT_569892, partial [Peziza echinospora]
MPSFSKGRKLLGMRLFILFQFVCSHPIGNAMMPVLWFPEPKKAVYVSTLSTAPPTVFIALSTKIQHNQHNLL